MLYFAYGSNLSLEQMKARCPETRPLRRHGLPGFRLVLRGVANIEEAPGGHCEGAIYEISEEDEKTLDGYESYPVLYDKGFFDTEDGPVMYYRMVEARFKEPREGYLETIKAGYRDWGLPTDGIERAVERYQEEYGSLA